MQNTCTRMTTTTVSIARVLALNVPLAWHEAVTISLRCAEQIAIKRVQAGFDTCTISSAGVADAVTSSSPFADDPLFCLVTSLVDRRDAPHELVSLLSRYESNRSLRAPLAGDLADFDRPDFSTAIRDVVRRASACEADAQAQAQLNQLRSAAGAPTTQRPPAKRPPLLARRRLIAAVGVGSVVAAGASVALLKPKAPSVLASAPVTTVAQTIDQLVDRGLEAMGLAADTAEATLERTPAPVEVASARKPRSALAASPLPAQHAMAPLTDGYLLMAGEPLAGRNGLADEENRESGTDDDGVNVDSGVYSVADVTVVPPVTLRAQLRSEDTAVGDVAPSYIEVLVNERGVVDRVRLQSRSNSVHDHMLLSAAKAWQFRPAIKDGRAVRYVMRIAIPYEEGR